MPFRQSSALESAAAWTARDSVTPRIPLLDLGSLVLVLRPETDAIPELPPTDTPLPPDRPTESGAHGPAVAKRLPPSTAQTFATAVEAAEMRAAADAAPLFESAEAGRSAAKTGECTGGTDVLLDLRFFGSFSLRGLGCCSAPALHFHQVGRLVLCKLFSANVNSIVTCWMNLS